jgi:SAM-dependent methyltransferase
MKWYYRWVYRSVISFVPFPSLFRHIKRGMTPHNAENAKGVLDRGLSMIESIEDELFSIKDKAVLELGSGWEPIIPLLYYLKGCDCVNLFDLNRLIEPISLKRCLDYLTVNAPEISKRLECSPEEIRSKLFLPQSARTLDEMLRHFRLKYFAPHDARTTGLPSSSIDVISSHTVLEHIPPSIIQEILTEFHRILKQEGKSCHLIDNADHWAQKDRSISAVNFLQFDETFWKVISLNRLDYQNRLRHNDYLDLFQKSGFKTVLDRSFPLYKESDPSSKFKLAAKYGGKSIEELSTLSFFVVKKTPPTD